MKINTFFYFNVICLLYFLSNADDSEVFFNEKGKLLNQEINTICSIFNEKIIEIQQ